MYRTSKIKQVAVAATIGLGGMLVLSGCEQLSSLPDEERYKYVNQVKEDLDYASSGEISRERYDTGDGVFSPSFFYSELEGDTSFDILTQRLQSLPDVDCEALVTEQSRCYIGRVEVKITRIGVSKTALQITDSSNGRTSDEG